MTPSLAPIAVLGAGSWGTALTLVVARNGYPVRLWDHWPAKVSELANNRENRRFLPGFPLPDAIEPVANLGQALAGAAEILVVVPSHGFAALLRALPPLGQDMGLALSLIHI